MLTRLLVTRGRLEESATNPTDMIRASELFESSLVARIKEMAIGVSTRAAPSFAKRAPIIASKRRKRTNARNRFPLENLAIFAAKYSKYPASRSVLEWN